MMHEPSSEPHKLLSVHHQLIASCAGALITSFFVTPFDVVKIRLQVQEWTAKGKKCNCFRHYSQMWDNLCYCCTGKCKRCSWHKPHIYFKGTWDAFVKIPRHEGFSSLWSGLSPSLIISVPSTAIYFTMYDRFHASLIETDHSVINQLAPLIAGVFSRVLTVSAVSPIEFLRTRMQAERVSYSVVLKSLKELVQQRGYIALWHGYVPSLLRDVPFSAIYWTVYENLKKVQEKPTFYQYFATGAIAGGIAAALTLPFDVIKSQRQAQLGNAALLNREVETNTVLLISKLYKGGGIKSLFTGFVPRLFKVSAACAIMISTYEYSKSYFSKQRQKHAQDLR